MLSTADVAPCGLETARPDLAIPLHQLRGPAESLRQILVSLREPSFVRAHEITIRWAAATFIVLISSQFPIPPSLRPWVVGIGIAMATYVIFRAGLLAFSERWQHEFEPVWLRTRSEMLRTHAFGVIRFTVQPDTRLAPDESPGRRVLDLTDPGDVREITRLQASERLNGTESRVVIEFVYWQDGGHNLAVERVKRYLKDVQFVPARRTLSQAYVRFPQARYAARPPMTRRDQGRPAQVTYWLLGESVSLTVSATETP